MAPQDDLRRVRAWLLQNRVEDDPLIVELRQAAALDGVPAARTQLPPWFAAWAIAIATAEGPRMARLAGLMLLRTSPPDLSGLPLVVLTARSSDLPLLQAVVPGEALKVLLAELEMACRQLQQPLAEALVAAVIPEHVNATVGVGFVAEHLENVCAVVVPGGALAEVLEWLRGIRRTKQARVEEARPAFERLLREVAAEATKLGQQALEETAVMRAAEALSSIDTSTMVLELAVVEKRADQIERLLLALALRSALRGKEEDQQFGSLVRQHAADAIYHLHALDLFPLRLRLIDEALAMGGPLSSLARLHLKRANTLKVVAPDAVGQLRVAFGLAVKYALQEGSPGDVAMAVAALAKQVAQTGSPEEIATTLERAIPAAMKPELSGVEQACLLQARAHLQRHTDLRQAVESWEAALRVLPPGDAFAVELAAELVSTLTKGGAAEEALDRGQDFLARTSSQPSVELGMLHCSVGLALAAACRFAEGRTRLESGLTLLRGQDWPLESLARCHLVEMGIRLDDKKLAEEHLRILIARANELDDAGKRDLERIETAVLAKWGAPGEHEERLRHQSVVASDERERLRNRLELLGAALQRGEVPDDTEEVLRRGLEHSPDLELDRLLEAICCHTIHAKGPVPREQLLSWARHHRHPVAISRLLQGLGRLEEARSELRIVLADPALPGGVRLACVHALLTILGVDPLHNEERMQLCDELESALDGGQDDPFVRLDLALALSIACETTPQVLLRAWKNGRRALDRPIASSIAGHGVGVMQKITVAFLRASSPRSDEEGAMLAEWFVGCRGLPPEKLANVQLSLAAELLLPGPFVHARALEVATVLVGAGAPVDPRGGKLLQARIDWISERRAGKQPSVAPELGGPLDDAAAWLVQLVQGTAALPAGCSLIGGLPHLRAALAARPHEADRVLAVLVASAVRDEERSAVLEAVYQALHEIPPRGNQQAPWPLLSEAVERATSITAGPLLLSIASRIGLSVDQGAIKPSAEPSARCPSPPLAEAREQACLLFESGVAAMRQAQLVTSVEHARGDIQRARNSLSGAVRLAQEARLPELCDYLVSLGNAWRLEPDRDIERALSLYDDALALATRVEQRAKIWKVEADALCARGGDEDLRLAASLLKQSISIRKGRLRAEALMSFAQVARMHPDHDALQRKAEPAKLLMAAAREDRSVGTAVLGALLEELGDWEALSPFDPTPAQLRTELAALYPEHRDELLSARSSRGLEHAKRMLAHPAAAFLLSIRRRLTTPEALRAEAAAAGLPADAAVRVAEQSARECLLGRPDEIERVLESIGEGQTPSVMPGVEAARVLLLAHLARMGRADVSAVERATEQAREGLSRVDDPHARAFVLRELADVWSPNDHRGDPVRDFDLAVVLLRDCMALEGGESAALPDTIAFLARALRYATAGDLGENLLECRRLYGRLVDRRLGSADLQASACANLAEVEAQMAEGTREARLGRSVALLERAVGLAQTPRLRAQSQSQLAWERTRLAMMLADPARAEGLRAALEAFDRVDVEHLEPHARRNWEANREVCAIELGHGSRSRADRIDAYRALLADAASSGEPYSVATAQHNLASELLFGQDRTFAEVEEGLRLSEQASAVRTLAADARHHWETSFNAGSALRQLLPRCQGAPWARLDAWIEAQRWLRQAVEAARSLGPGEELTSAALELALLSCMAPSTRELTGVAEEAWRVVREAGPWLVLDRASRESEAVVAGAVVCALASRMATEALPVVSNGVGFALRGERAEAVFTWLLRAQSPSRRPLRARLARPEAASAALWFEWEQALGRRDPRTMGDVLRQLQGVAPAFLGEDGVLEPTREWLAARPGSIAVHAAPPPFPGPWLVAVLHLDGSGRLQRWVLGLTPPEAPEHVRDTLEWRSPENELGPDLHDASAAWIRLHIVEPVLHFLGARPTEVLWVPGLGLRRLSPSALWPGVAVAMSTALELPELRGAPRRARSTLVTLVDPGPQGSEAALGAHGIAAFERLTELARKRGRVRRLASEGARFGRDLLGPHQDVRHTPASASDILEEAAEHDLVVLIAHGSWESPEDASLHCLDAEGRTDRLDVARLAASPGRLTGATVVLLCCESGQTGPGLAEPGGVAGTLIAAGARCVVAPLRPVLLSVARQVAEAVLTGFAEGRSAEQSLSQVQDEAQDGGPTLGRPVRSLSARKREESSQRLAYVTWVG